MAESPSSLPERDECAGSGLVATGASRGQGRVLKATPKQWSAHMFLAGKTAIVTGSTSGIGLAYAQGAGGRRARRVVINGFGDADAIEAERAALAAASGAEAFYDRRRHEQAGADHGDGRRAQARHPDQQRRHPACRADRRISGRQVGRDHRDQPVERISRGPRRRAAHEGAGLGPDHLDRVGAQPGREPEQGGRMWRRNMRWRG